MRSSREIATDISRRIGLGEWELGAKLPSIREFADNYKVSINTIQRALSHLEATKLIECQPRRKGIVRSQYPLEPAKKASQLGILFPDQVMEGDLLGMESWTGRIVESIRVSAARAGYDLNILSPQSLLPGSFELRHAGLAGVVAFQVHLIEQLVSKLESARIPIVSIGRPNGQSQHNFVTTDYHAGGAGVGRCFAASGYHRVLVLTGDPAQFHSGAEEIAALTQVYLMKGLDPSGIRVSICDESGAECGYEQTRAFLRRNKAPQGVFAAGDRLALGAIRALQEAGLRVPEDVSVVGATGLELSRHSTPSLSVVQQPMEQIGRSAVEMLLEMTNTDNRRLPGLVLPPQLVARQSLVVSQAVAADWTKDTFAMAG